MENTSPAPAAMPPVLQSQQHQPVPPQQPPRPVPIGRITIVIAVVLFFIGLGVYISSAKQTPPDAVPYSQRPPTTAITKADRVPGQIIVKFKDGVSDEQITKLLKPFNASIKDTVEGVNSTVINVQPGQEQSVLKELSSQPLVKYAEPDYVYYLQYTPNDPQLGLQWDLRNIGQMVNGKFGVPNADIKAEQAWDITKGAGVRVAVLDSGIDVTHPEFANKIIAAQAFASSSPMDMNGHGTHVAGIIAATGNNGQGITGVCPECLLLIGKITIDDASGSVPTSAIGSSISWAANSGAQVINMSIAGPDFSQTVQDAINLAWSKNAVVISAAGNNAAADKSFPAGYDHVVSVANTNSSDALSPTSNFGSWVTVAAPGDNIYSTFPTTPNVRNVNNYGFLGGTSMASPVVSGVAALIWKTQYGTSNQAVVSRLIATADKIPGTGTQWMYGRVNAAAAVGVTVTPTAVPTLTSTPTVTVTPSQVPTPSAEPTEIVIVPTFVCGGSTNSICPTTPPIQPQTTIVPPTPANVTPGGGTYPTGPEVPSVGPEPYPSGVVTPTPASLDINTIFGQLELPTFEPEKVPGCKHHKKATGGIGNLVQLLVGFFFALIQKLILLLGLR